MTQPGAEPTATEGEPAASAQPADDITWQRLWLSMRRRPWSTLALIPADGSIDTKRVAEALAAVGARHLGSPVHIIDATDLPIEQLNELTGAAAAYARQKSCALIVLGPLAESPPSAELARAADAAVLCVALGESRIKDAQAAIAEVGAERFLGAVIAREFGRRS